MELLSWFSASLGAVCLQKESMVGLHNKQRQDINLLIVPAGV